MLKYNGYYSLISFFFFCLREQGVPDTVPEGGIIPPPLDSAWAESTRKKALLKLEKLDTDLKNYKGNSIKESIRYYCGICVARLQFLFFFLYIYIYFSLTPLCWFDITLWPAKQLTSSISYLTFLSTRRGHDDLGDHYLDCGDLSNALKCYSRARDYCTSAKHVINMCLNVIKVLLNLFFLLFFFSYHKLQVYLFLLDSKNSYYKLFLNLRNTSFSIPFKVLAGEFLHLIN